METDQIKLLKALAKNIKTKKKDRAKVMISLQSAKILNKNEDFTRAYGNLQRFITEK
ncbi:hypothetical protein [Chryseobacterium camelliae]|uniref:hypothetical protein n=1 Tax=Chryseobacterium camelliae TaxID=1265445 RepID=UPI0012FE25E0|nr:hypothetical protein [Chryseobacterium camelliae]